MQYCLGSFKFPFSQEICLLISLILIALLMGYLVRTFSKDKRNTIIGTAIIIFVYRAMPSPGAGLGPGMK